MNRFLKAWRSYRCKCRYKSICPLLDLGSKTCMAEGSNYCGQYRKLTHNFEQALVERFGPAHRIDGNLCVIILKTQINRGIERLLLERKYLAYYQILDQTPAVFVVLKDQGGSAWP